MRTILITLVLLSTNVSASSSTLASQCLLSLEQKYAGNADLKVRTVEIGPSTEHFAIIRFSLKHLPTENLQCNEAAVTNDKSCTVLSVADTMMCE